MASAHPGIRAAGDVPRNGVLVPSGARLRERQQARGAKPHSRMSDLSRYLLAHQDELHALINVDGYAWADIAAVLVEDGLTDEAGRPVTATAAKLAWSRLRRRRAKLLTVGR
jgi:hypothetical protein